MNLMASAFLMLLAVVGMVVFIADLTIVDSSLLVPLTTTPTTPPTTTTTTTTMPTTTARPFNCKRMMLSMGKKVFKTYGVCNRDMKVFIPDMKERAKKFNCSTKCVLKKLHIVNEKDLITEKSITSFLEGLLPPEFLEIALIGLGGCIEEFTDKGELPLEENYCDSYGEFLNCIQGSFQGACGV